MNQTTKPSVSNAHKERARPSRTNAANARVRRDPEGTRQRILDAATREFSDDGYAGARVDHIAKRAGTVDRMLYYYFGSKEGLYRAVLEQTYDKLVSSQASLNLSGVDPVQGLRDLIRFTWNYYIDHPELIRLFNTENLHFGRHIKRSTTIKKLSMPVINIIKDLLHRGALAGSLRDDADPIQLYITIAALGYFYLSNRYTLSQFLGTNLMDAHNRDAWVAHVTDVVLAHLCSRA